VKVKTLLFASLLLSAAAWGSTPSRIDVRVDGVSVSFPHGQPMEWKGHVMVPIRGVFEKLGANVSWDGAAQKVTIVRSGSTIEMTVGESHALKNQETIVTNVKSILRGGTCYIPLRFLAESLDANVHWDGATRSVSITTEKTVPSPSSQRQVPPPPPHAG
jgi:spore coat protein H